MGAYQLTVDPTGIYPVATSRIAVGGTAVTIIYGPVLGGLIVNPYSAEDQGLDEIENLYVDLVTDASLGTTSTSVEIQAGQSFTIPPQTTNVSVNAATSGHKFSAITFQPVSPPTPGELVGVDNPCLQNLIPSYLYQQYANDDDLQAFVASFNTLAQEYVTWLNAVSLPVYTGPLIVGTLLDWVALGLYGMRRPVLSSGNVVARGELNTYVLNSLAFNARRIINPAVFAPVSDDIFKRVLTWNLYKGDGKQLNIGWLKRRILRFLLGDNGTDPDTSDTQQISVTFSDDNEITITVLEDYFVSIPQGSLFNRFALNSGPLNIYRPGSQLAQRVTEYTHGNQINITLLQPILPNAEIFKEAIEQGVLDMPFQFKAVVIIEP